MNKYYIYIYLDPRKPGNYKYNNLCFNYEPIYIGKGKGYRYRGHLYSNYKNTNPFLKAKLIKL